MIAYIGLGSNLGDAEANLARARAALAGLTGVRPGRCSPVYQSDPQGLRDQPWFANQVVQLYCAPDWTASAMLHAMADIENRMGRVRLQPGGPRLIDLDLLLFNGQTVNTPELTLPHPRMKSRAFVLVPLRDIAPELVFPDGTNLIEIIAKLPHKLAGRCIMQP